MNASRRLDEVLTLDLDRVEVKPDERYPVAGVYSFGRGLFERGPMPGSSTSYAHLNRLRAGQLVLSRLKAFEGAVAVVPPELDGWYLSQEFPTFSLVPTELDARYLAHVCRWPDFWSALASTSKGIGARRERVHPSALLELELALPMVEEQTRIARRLDRLQERLDHLAERREQVVRVPPKLVHAARASFASPDGLARGSDVEFENAVLGDVADFVNGTSYDRGQLDDDGDPIIRISNISDPTSPYLRTRQVFDERFRVAPGDLLVSWSASFKTIIWQGPPGVLNQHIFNVRERDGMDRRFLRHLIEAVFAEMRVQAVGIGMMHLRRDAFLNQRVCVPGIDSQRTIAKRLDEIERLMTTAEALQRRTAHLIRALQTSVLNEEFAGLS